MERTAIASEPQLAIGFARLRPRQVGGHEDEGVEPRVVLRDTAEQILDELGGVEAPFTQSLPERLDRHWLAHGHVAGCMLLGI